jgi:hypothetical protein
MNQRKKLFGAAGAVVLLSAGVLAACTAVVVEERPLPPRPDRPPQFCTQQYDPVCARRGGDRRTFGNACEAERAGYFITYPGECRGDGPGWGGPGPGRPDRPQFCTREYAPVCAVSRGGSRQTFGNACEADAAGYRIIYDGRC